MDELQGVFAVMGVEGAENPVELRCGLRGLQAYLLNEVVLAVGEVRICDLAWQGEWIPQIDGAHEFSVIGD